MNTTSSGSSSGVPGLIGLIIAIIDIVALWRLYTKAGQHGWAAIIPIYNIIVLLKIVGRPWWWLILLLVPLVNIIVGIVVYIDLAKAFGKGALYGLGLLILSFIFLPMLAFGDATYLGPQHT